MCECVGIHQGVQSSGGALPVFHFHSLLGIVHHIIQAVLGLGHGEGRVQGSSDSGKEADRAE